MFSQLLQYFKAKMLGDQRARWNYQYAKGRWAGLSGELEDARFQTLIHFLLKYKPYSTILEVGCGEALLQRKLPANSYRYLKGIDLSDVAIQRAKAFENSQTAYEVADMNTYIPTQSYDAIVFTESIIYTLKPDVVLRNYSNHLVPNGIFIISIFEDKKSAHTWQKIAEVATLMEEKTTENERGKWICKVLKPH